MKFLKTSIAVLVLSFAVAGAGTNSWKKLMGEDTVVHRYQIQIPAHSNMEVRDAAKIIQANGFDLSGVNYQNQTLEVIANDDAIKVLNSKGLHGKIVESKGKSNGKDIHFLAEGAESETIDPQFLNPARLETKLKALNAKFPNLTRLEQIGTSLENRPIWGLLVSNSPVKGDVKATEKPTIIIDGMHHAREIMTTEVVSDFAEFLLSNYDGKDPQAKQIVDSWNVWFVPMVNPDGNNIVWTRDNWWRKNAHATGSTTHGVDINRNYNFQWNKCNGSSGSTGAQDYRGSSAASEPETQTLQKFADEVKPTAYLSYHSYSELVIYPYGCDGQFTGENELESKIGNELAMLLPADSGSGHYAPGTPWQLLYSVDGDSAGYMFGAHGALSFTFEVNQSFQPSYSLKQPTVEKHRKMLMYFFKRTTDNLLKIKVVDGKTSQPVQAKIKINTILHKAGERDFETNSAGNYFKVLDPGAYILNFADQKGRTAELKLDMAGN